MNRLQRALNRFQAERAAIPLAPPASSDIGVEPVNTADTQIIVRTRIVPVKPKLLKKNGVLPADCSGPAGHSFKMLRTQVLQRLRQHGWNSLAVISPTPKDGKTFTAANLAIAIAGDTKHTTLLVDLDLRNPNVAKRFGLQPEVGVEECLRDEAPLSSAFINPEGYPKLVLLPCREPVSNSSELLASERTQQLVREIRERYPNRVVIFDLPPVLGADDALAFAPQVHAALVVIREEHTRREDVVRCFELMRETTIIGTVLNGAQADHSLAYAY